MDPRDIALEHILHLLSQRSPELGARLKQQLNVLLVKGGLDHFDEKIYGYKRFSDFLKASFGERILIERPEGAGDITVTLRHSPGVHPVLVKRNPQKNTAQLPVIRSDVWQAFVNADSNRKRFLHKETKAIKHYLQTEDSLAKTEVVNDLSNYIEIIPIASSVQAGWMKTFLFGLKVSVSQRTALEALAGEAYSSALNAAFTRALGEHAEAWRHYRVNHVMEFMRQWTKDHCIRFDDFCVPAEPKEVSQTKEIPEPSQLAPRQQAIRLLELLSEEDIARSIIPTLLSVFLVKSKF